MRIYIAQPDRFVPSIFISDVITSGIKMVGIGKLLGKAVWRETAFTACKHLNLILIMYNYI